MATSRIPLRPRAITFLSYFDKIENPRHRTAASMTLQGNEETNYRKLTSRNTILTIILFVSPLLLLYLAVNYEASALIKGQIYSRLAESVAENTKTITLFLQD